MSMPTNIPSRCWRLQAFTDYKTNPRIEYLREAVTEYEDGNVVKKPLATVARTLAEVAATPIAGGPVVCNTMGEVFALVAACGHQLAAEDDARVAAAAAEEAARRAAAEPAA